MPAKSPMGAVTLALLASIAASVAPPARTLAAPVPPVTPGTTSRIAPASAQSTTAAMGSAFTYQGMLRNGGSLAQGGHDFVFALWSDSTGGSQIGSSLTTLGVQVTNGFFTVALDFGSSAFDGNARWLNVQVRTAGGGSYTALSPRIALRPAPYALRSANAGQWTNDTYGIDYLSKVGIGTTTNPTATMWVNSGTTNNNTLYVTSSNGPWAALGIRNFGSNGWGLYDDTSMNHYLYGRLGLGQLNPAYPLDVQNTVGSGLRILSTGTSLSAGYPGEGVRAAMFVHGNTGSGAFGSNSNGIFASSDDARAVTAWSNTNWGVDGNCIASGCYGVLGTPNEGVFGYTPNTSHPAAHLLAPTGGTALLADGIIKTKTLQILGGSDLAEPFDVSRAAGVTPEPGSVVVIDPAHPGDLVVSDRAYDTRVAGVISGANRLAPGMVMQSDAEHSHGDHPVALTGRVWCKVDASYGAVKPGDLLTTSPTPGNAMLAGEPALRSGAVIGKAMTSLEAGCGLVLVLVSLQ